MDAADASRWNRETPPPPGGLDTTDDYDAQIALVAEMVTAQRASAWETGDRLLHLRDCVRADAARRGLSPTREEGLWRAVRKRCASLCHQGDGYMKALVQMSGTFGTEQRYGNVSQALYRACIAAGRRLWPATGDDAADEQMRGAKAREVLDMARARGWHVADVQQVGKADTGPRLKLTATCGTCGAVVRIVVPDSSITVGLPAVPCPVCTARAWVDGDTDAAALAKLGCLEAAA